MPIAQYDVIGFIDDDPVKQGINIHGIPVLGTVPQLPQICKDRNIEEIAIAMPSATRQQLRRVIQVCEGTQIRFRTVPSITDIASGKLRVSEIRDVDINDLLGREVVHLDLDQIEAFARDKTILVTGAGGSIGSEMCRQICHFGPRLLLLVEQAENPLVLRGTRPAPPVPGRTDQAPDLRHHGQGPGRSDLRAAQAPGGHPRRRTQARAADGAQSRARRSRTTSWARRPSPTRPTGIGATHFVMISTDKAVNPTSIMGSSKRIAEMYIQDLGKTSRTQFVTVRFGNVLGSEGSVVPIFKKQIAEGGPVTVTHPEMKRYFMTIPEASQLVLQAASMGQGGEIFLLDMGEPVQDRGPGQGTHHAQRLPARRGHRDRLHRPASRREALRGASHRGRGHAAHPPPEDQHLAEHPDGPGRTARRDWRDARARRAGRMSPS